MGLEKHGTNVRVRLFRMQAEAATESTAAAGAATPSSTAHTTPKVRPIARPARCEDRPRSGFRRNDFHHQSDT